MRSTDDFYYVKIVYHFVDSISAVRHEVVSDTEIFSSFLNDLDLFNVSVKLLSSTNYNSTVILIL